MKLITYVHEGIESAGAMLGPDAVLDLAHAARLSGAPDRDAYASMLALIRAGDGALASIREWLAKPPAAAVRARDRIRLRAPLPLPEQIRDFANYELHVRQAMASSMQLRAAAAPDPQAALDTFRQSGQFNIPPVWYEVPLYYKGNRFTAIGHEEDVVWPHYAHKLDYELELAIVIGKRTKDADPRSAMDAVFGYTIYNDFSARDAQARESQFRMGPAKGKDFDTGNAFGPCIITRDEIPDPTRLAMVARVNGVERTRTVSGGMQHSIAECIRYVSMSETLYPGEILGLGTVGNGCGYESLTFLSPGDVVELEIEGIGVLRNRLIKPQA